MSTAAAGTVEDFWAERDTSPEAIDGALRRLLHERHVANDRLVPARVLNLIVVVDRDWKGETANRLERVGRYHASRTVLCSVQEGRTTIDATALLSYEEPKDGGIGAVRERVQIDLGPGHLSRLDTIVDPVLGAELPTVLWCPNGHHEAVAALLQTIDVMLVDSDEGDDPAEALARVSELLESVYVVDLAWLRTTPWRERLAASFDHPARRHALQQVAGLSIDHRGESRASALLLTGWLASRLHWHASPLNEDTGQLLTGSARRTGGELGVRLNPVPLESPGLASVALACDGEHPLAIALKRAPGGLTASESLDDGSYRSWKILGASRGEGGILGEGVRQALLRDVTYGPALEAARRLCPR
jgi:glucose-6-phosphate dehydrogenase assembly protein OpcA